MLDDHILRLPSHFPFKCLSERVMCVRWLLRSRSKITVLWWETGREGIAVKMMDILVQHEHSVRLCARVGLAHYVTPRHMPYLLSVRFLIFPPASAWDPCVWRAVTLDLKIQAEFTATMEAAHVFISLQVCCKACVEREKKEMVGNGNACGERTIARSVVKSLTAFFSFFDIFMLLFFTFVCFGTCRSFSPVIQSISPLEKMRLQRVGFK